MSDFATKSPNEILSHKTGNGWIGVDFDGTLAKYHGWDKTGYTLGKPVLLMVERVKRWLAKGQEVRIFTARAAHNSARREIDIELIKQWCRVHIGQELEVTAEKDFNMVALWDDRAVSVMPNEGYSNSDPHPTDPLTMDEELRMWKSDQRDNDE